MLPNLNFLEDDENDEGEALNSYEPPQWAQSFVPPEEAMGYDNTTTPMTMDDKPEPEVFEARPLKSRRLELEAFGEAGPRSECFGCVYFGEKDTTIPSDELVKLIEMSRQSLGRIDMICLAKGMADYYEKHIRQKINRNLMPGQRPLPEWKEAQILEHIRFHNQDPLVQQVIILAETQELRAALFDCCFEVSSKTGKMRPNKNNIKAYEEAVKLQFHVQKQDASKMSFFSAGARVNPEILSQGLLSTHTKNLHNYWKA
jgi:hypothetical protein